MMKGGLLLMTLLVPGTDDPFQSEDLVEGDPGTDVEDAQYCGLSRCHSQIAITRDDNDPVNLVFERIDPVGHELAVDSRSGITEVRSVLELAALEGSVTHIVLEAQLNNTLARKSPLTVIRLFTLVRPNWENAMLTPESCKSSGALPCSAAFFLLAAIFARSS